MSLTVPSFPIVLNSFYGGSSLTTGTSNLCPGTNFQTGQMAVGNRFRFTVNISKTAAGTQPWSFNLRYGSSNSNADTSIMSGTSGTNTAAADKMQLTFDVFISTINTSGAIDALVMNRAQLLAVNTGLGGLATVITSSSLIDTTQTANYFGLYITPGTGASIYSGWALAERWG